MSVLFDKTMTTTYLSYYVQWIDISNEGDQKLPVQRMLPTKTIYI